MIVSAILGALIGGWISDNHGEKYAYNRSRMPTIEENSIRGSAPGSMVSTKGANYVGRGSNPTNRHLGR